MDQKNKKMEMDGMMPKEMMMSEAEMSKMKSSASNGMGRMEKAQIHKQKTMKGTEK